MKKFILSAIVALSLSACGGGGSSSSVPSVNIAGNYSGAIQDNRAGAGTATLNVTQSGSTLGGTFSDSFTNGTQGASGTLSGTMSGSSVVFTLTVDGGFACPYNFSGTLSGATISGTYAVANCTVSDGGTLTVTHN